MAGEKCEECGMPVAECTALAVGRNAAEQFLREKGMGGVEARNVATRLIPVPKRQPE